jgi:hypothetical protein
MGAGLFCPPSKEKILQRTEDAQACIRSALRRRRRTLGLTQEDAAGMLGLSRMTYHRSKPEHAAFAFPSSRQSARLSTVMWGNSCRTVSSPMLMPRLQSRSSGRHPLDLTGQQQAGAARSVSTTLAAVSALFAAGEQALGPDICGTRKSICHLRVGPGQPRQCRCLVYVIFDYQIFYLNGSWPSTHCTRLHLTPLATGSALCSAKLGNATTSPGCSRKFWFKISKPPPIRSSDCNNSTTTEILRRLASPAPKSVCHS